MIARRKKELVRSHINWKPLNRNCFVNAQEASVSEQQHVVIIIIISIIVIIIIITTKI